MSWKKNAESDPLLPHNDPSPEIHTGRKHSNQNSAEIKYSTYEPDFSLSSEHGERALPTYAYGGDERHHNQQYGRLNNAPVNSYGTGHNFNSGKGYTDRSGSYQDNSTNDDNEHDASSPSATKRALNTIISMFVVVVFFSIVAMTLDGEGKPAPQPVPVPHPSHGRTMTWVPQPTDRPNPGKPEKSIEERVHSILTSVPLLDGHNDLAIFIRATYGLNITSKQFENDWEHGDMKGDVDLVKLRKGMAGGALWSAFVPCPVPSYRTGNEQDEENSTDEEYYDESSKKGKKWEFLDSDYAKAMFTTTQQIDLLQRLQRAYPDDFVSTNAAAMNDDDGMETSQAMLHVWRESGGRKLFGPLSIEGLHQISPSAPMSSLRLLYSMGVRAATLTWNCHNAFADASLVWKGFDKDMEVVDTKKVRGGITKEGRRVIREMNRLGMLVDISHTSYHTQLAAMGRKGKKENHAEDFDGASIAPVIFSHSSAYSICPHPRNVRDDVLDQVKRTGSLVMVNFSPNFISCTAPSSSSSSSSEASTSKKIELPDFYEKNNTLHQVARHILYIGQRIGFEHVGLGSDFDGMGDLTPRGLEGVDKYPDLVAELLKMGVTDEQAKGIVGDNFLRVWGEVERVGKEMRRNGVEESLDSNPNLSWALNE